MAFEKASRLRDPMPFRSECRPSRLRAVRPPARTSARFNLPASFVLASALVWLGGCSSLGTRAPEPERAPTAGTAKPPAQLPRPGGYYQDDGPGENPPRDMASISDAEPRVEPLHRFANNPYSVLGQDFVPMRELRAYRERGTGSWYGRKFHGQRTSSGEPYDMYGMTAAHPVLPIPSYARVTNPANGRNVIVRINDRGPFHSGRIIDLSYTAAWKLGYAAAGSAQLEVESITPGDIPLLSARRNPAGRPVPQVVARAESAAGTALVNGSRSSAASIPVAGDTRGLYLQLGAFSGKDNAENFRAKLGVQLNWLDRAIEVFQRDGLYRLHLGPYRDRAEAAGIAERIRDALDVKTILVIR